MCAFKQLHCLLPVHLSAVSEPNALMIAIGLLSKPLLDAGCIKFK